MTIWREYLYDTAIDTNTIPGRKLLRLSTGTPNIGRGALELRGGEVVGDKQIVYQRVYRDDNTWWDRPCGEFTYHQGHRHIHFDDWCIYRLRVRNSDGTPGAVLRTGEKVSFCVLDLQVFDSSLPGFNSNGRYRSCGATVQGISVGWADIYDRSLPDQWIDITGIPDGVYILEAEVDPNGQILELNESNNVGQVEVAIGPPPPVEPDAYEENDSRSQVDGRPEGGQNSPNLGLVNARKRISPLSIDDSADWFKFRMNNAGGAGDFVQINSPYGDSDLDLVLYDANGNQLGRSDSSTNFEQISLNGRPAGSYYVLVFPYSGRNPGYELTIEPSGNGVPTIDVSVPTETIWVERAFEAFEVRWSATDPENDPLAVSLFYDPDGVRGKDTQPVAGYQGLPNGIGTVNVNTAGLPLGQWYFSVVASDGGATAEDWAPGRVIIYQKGDVNFDGVLSLREVGLAMQALKSGNYPPSYRIIFDMDRDGDFDHEDLHELVHEYSTHDYFKRNPR